DDDRTAGQAHASLRNRRDRKRILALQKPLSKLKPKSQSAAPDQAVQPRPASPDRALTGVPFTSSNRGPFYTKRRGPVSTVIDTEALATVAGKGERTADFLSRRTVEAAFHVALQTAGRSDIAG